MIHDIDDVVRTLRGIRGLLLYLAENPSTELDGEYLTDMLVLVTDNLDSVLAILDPIKQKEEVS